MERGEEREKRQGESGRERESGRESGREGERGREKGRESFQLSYFVV